MIDLKKIIFHQTDTWPILSEFTLEPNSVLADFLKIIFQEGIFVEINRLLTSKEYPNAGGIGHIILIGICSALDTLSAYFSGGGRGRVGVGFTNFIARYFPAQYVGKEQRIYDSFRCDSVHGWNLHKSTIRGVPNDPAHLLEENGIIFISLYDFFNDLNKAFVKYEHELRFDNSLRINFLKRYKELGK